jgi:hypothetical protein
MRNVGAGVDLAAKLTEVNSTDASFAVFFLQAVASTAAVLFPHQR